MPAPSRVPVRPPRHRKTRAPRAQGRRHLPRWLRSLPQGRTSSPPEGPRRSTPRAIGRRRPSPVPPPPAALLAPRESAAPALPREPATTASRPKLPLCESAGRGRTEPADVLGFDQFDARAHAPKNRPRDPDVGDHDGPAAAARGIGDVADLRSSERDRPRGANDTVRSRRPCPKRGPKAGPPKRLAVRDRLIAATTRAAAPRRGRVRPVPKSASTTPSAAQSALARRRLVRLATSAKTIVKPAPRARSRFSRASPRYPSGSPSVKTWTDRPRSKRSRAAARPSPPLLPGPQTTTTAFQSGVGAAQVFDERRGGAFHEVRRGDAAPNRRAVGSPHPPGVEDRDQATPSEGGGTAGRGPAFGGSRARLDYRSTAPRALAGRPSWRRPSSPAGAPRRRSSSERRTSRS